MTSNALFWIPAFLRVGVLLVAAAVVGWYVTPMAGLAILSMSLLALLTLQLRYLQRLAAWLDAPGSRLPDGWGAWSHVFARLYRLRREDEKVRVELAEWLARFREAMGQLPDGVAILDDVLFLEWCNKAAEQHLGLNLARDQGLRITNLVRNPGFIDYLILGRFEQPLELERGENRYLVHLIPFQNRRRILVTHDMTKTTRIDRMRRDFIANASHELRTPLTVINGFLELASGDDDMPAEVRKHHLELMLEQGRRMQVLIDDMLALTGLESTDLPLHAEYVPMGPLLQDVLTNALALSAGRHQVTLEDDGPDLIASAGELRSAFMNLASNAVRYTPPGGSITIAWKNSPAGPQFCVNDTGIGIAPEHIPRLTERFYRVDKDRSRQSQGTGLGLAIVKHVLIRHGARLDIHSVPGQGSCFTATFPAQSTRTRQSNAS